MRCSSFGFVVLLGRTPGTVHHGRAGGRRDLRYDRRTCCLPSGLSPSVQELHLVNRPLAAVGSRTVTAGSEFHRPRSTCCSMPQLGAVGPRRPPVRSLTPRGLGTGRACGRKPRGPGAPARCCTGACFSPTPRCSAASPARRRGGGARSPSTCTAARCTARSTPCAPRCGGASGWRCGSPAGSAPPARTPAHSAAWISERRAAPSGTASSSCRSRGRCPSRWTSTGSSCGGRGGDRRARTRSGRTTSGWRCSTRSSSPTVCRGARWPSPGRMRAPPAALDVHRLDASLRHGRATWWAEVAPAGGLLAPRCSCCPLLLDDATAFLVALDVAPGCACTSSTSTAPHRAGDSRSTCRRRRGRRRGLGGDAPMRRGHRERFTFASETFRCEREGCGIGRESWDVPSVARRPDPSRRAARRPRPPRPAARAPGSRRVERIAERAHEAGARAGLFRRRRRHSGR